MNSKLEKLDKWLKENTSGYSSMVLIGSVAVGDKLIQERSDVDILILFEDLKNGQPEKVQDYLKNTTFNDKYTFVPMEKEYWLRNNNHSHDFSGKFRSKIISGEDLIKQKQIPDKETALKIYTTGLEDIKARISRTIVNSGIWSESKIKNVFWKLFKHTFMYLAIKCYYKENNYPKTREEIAKRLNSNILDRTLITLNNIDEKSKEAIVEAGQELLDYLKNEL